MKRTKNDINFEWLVSNSISMEMIDFVKNNVQLWISHRNCCGKEKTCFGIGEEWDRGICYTHSNVKTSRRIRT